MPDLPKIKARYEAATDGEWIVVDFPADPYRPRRLQVQCGGRLICEIENPEGEDEDNAEFIARARSDIPALVTASEEAQGKLERIEATHMHYEPNSDGCSVCRILAE